MITVWPQLASFFPVGSFIALVLLFFLLLSLAWLIFISVRLAIVLHRNAKENDIVSE